uniref:Uncharacterized protein n=1 Tax=Acrobeloides nanus TaxID=290746 RepID=A0A914DHN9_9BILA
MIDTPIHMRQKEEDLILLRLIFDRKDLLFSYLNPQLTSEDKYENWSTIFEECRRLKQYWLSEKNSYGRIADVNYLRHVKWKRLKGETLNKLESYTQSTNTLPTLNEIDHLILDIIGRENVPYLVNASASKIDWQWIERSQTNQQSEALTR